MLQWSLLVKWIVHILLHPSLVWGKGMLEVGSSGTLPGSVQI